MGIQFEFKQKSPWSNGTFKGAMGMLQTSLEQLKYYQKHKTSNNMSELAWEIEFMEWCFAGGEERCQEFFDNRYDANHMPLDTRIVAKKMGYGK